MQLQGRKTKKVNYVGLVLSIIVADRAAMFCTTPLQTTRLNNWLFWMLTKASEKFCIVKLCF